MALFRAETRNIGLDLLTIGLVASIVLAGVADTTQVSFIQLVQPCAINRHKDK